MLMTYCNNRIYKKMKKIKVLVMFKLLLSGQMTHFLGRVVSIQRLLNNVKNVETF